MLSLNLVFQFIFCFLMTGFNDWLLRMSTEADTVSDNTGWVSFSVSVLLLFLVENCLKTLLLVHLHWCFDGKTPNGFRQTKCCEDVDSVLLDWGSIKLSDPAMPGLCWDPGTHRSLAAMNSFARLLGSFPLVPSAALCKGCLISLR